MSLVRPLRMSSSPAMKKRPTRVLRRPRTTSAAHMNVSLACATRTNLHTAPKTALDHGIPAVRTPPLVRAHGGERVPPHLPQRDPRFPVLRVREGVPRPRSRGGVPAGFPQAPLPHG